ncbi:MAG TPA: gamma carbonic anhydrase family protein [bacterium]|jgi:carbonic anhydrase/acetyltransferase-like protein (isoleucine patch superfamily)|nr:gamma carbonic anhydrase family protein [bacterium]HXC63511.1 gamma carbonic anhydrase family protein [bacterium]
MLQPYLDKRPRLLGPVRAHATAVVIGDVELGEGVSLWPQVVLRGDYNSIKIGARSNIQDGSVVHNDTVNPAVIGADCVVGHRAVIHGCVIGDRCLIGIGAIILNGAIIGDECIVGAGALVPEGREIPPRSVVMGMPCKVVRASDAAMLERTLRGVEAYQGYAERQLPLLEALPD